MAWVPQTTKETALPDGVADSLLRIPAIKALYDAAGNAQEQQRILLLAHNNRLEINFNREQDLNYATDLGAKTREVATADFKSKTGIEDKVWSVMVNDAYTAQSFSGTNERELEAQRRALVASGKYGVDLEITRDPAGTYRIIGIEEPAAAKSFIDGSEGQALVASEKTYVYQGRANVIGGTNDQTYLVHPQKMDELAKSGGPNIHRGTIERATEFGAALSLVTDERSRNTMMQKYLDSFPGERDQKAIGQAIRLAYDVARHLPEDRKAADLKGNALDERSAQTLLDDRTDATKRNKTQASAATVDKAVKTFNDRINGENSTFPGPKAQHIRGKIDEAERKFEFSQRNRPKQAAYQKALADADDKWDQAMTRWPVDPRRWFGALGAIKDTAMAHIQHAHGAAKEERQKDREATRHIDLQSRREERYQKASDEYSHKLEDKRHNTSVAVDAIDQLRGDGRHNSLMQHFDTGKISAINKQDIQDIKKAMSASGVHLKDAEVRTIVQEHMQSVKTQTQSNGRA